MQESDIRHCFGCTEHDDLFAHLTRATHDLETVPLLERELDKLRGKLEEAHRQLIEKDSLNST